MSLCGNYTTVTELDTEPKQDQATLTFLHFTC